MAELDGVHKWRGDPIQLLTGMILQVTVLGTNSQLAPENRPKPKLYSIPIISFQAGVNS